MKKMKIKNMILGNMKLKKGMMQINEKIKKWEKLY